ncbi:unnamed protein product [Prunus armeniaca]
MTGVPKASHSSNKNMVPKASLLSNDDRVPKASLLSNDDGVPKTSLSSCRTTLPIRLSPSFSSRPASVAFGGQTRKSCAHGLGPKNFGKGRTVGETLEHFSTNLAFRQGWLRRIFIVGKIGFDSTSFGKGAWASVFVVVTPPCLLHSPCRSARVFWGNFWSFSSRVVWVPELSASAGCLFL